MIAFDSTICGDFDAGSSREWLETNGIGGFASGTISGANTRRYHGIFTPATEPPLGRITMLSKLEETVTVGGNSYELSANQYPNMVHPQGFRFLRSFRLDPFPIWTFEVDGIEIEKKIFMVHGQNTVVCTWKVKRAARGDRRPVELEVRPLVSFVDYHHLRHDHADVDAGYEVADDSVMLQPVRNLPPVYFQHCEASVERTGYWYRDFEYAIEKERGFDFRENLFQPFALKFDLSEAARVIGRSLAPRGLRRYACGPGRARCRRGWRARRPRPRPRARETRPRRSDCR